MALEPSLQHFDYFISIDADAYLTKPLGGIVDPFEVMQRHNLSGITVNDCQNYGFDQGVAATARRVFGPPTSSSGISIRMNPFHCLMIKVLSMTVASTAICLEAGSTSFGIRLFGILVDGWCHTRIGIE